MQNSLSIKKWGFMEYDEVNDNGLLVEEAIRRFRLDVEELSIVLLVKDEEEYYRYLNEEGELDVLKVFYYGKDLKEAFKYQDMALRCMEYVNLYEHEYKEYAMDFIYRYLNLREDPLANMWELEDLSKREELGSIYRTLEYMLG